MDVKIYMRAGDQKLGHDLEWSKGYICRLLLFTGLDYWTGILDWTTGLEYWTGLLDCGFSFFRQVVYMIS